MNVALTPDISEIAINLLARKTCDVCQHRHLFFGTCPLVEVTMDYITFPKYQTCSNWKMDDPEFIPIIS